MTFVLVVTMGESGLAGFHIGGSLYYGFGGGDRR